MSQDPYDIGEIVATPEKKRPSLRRRVFRAFLTMTVLIGFVTAIGALGVYLIYDHITQPRVPTGQTVFTVPQGATGNDVAMLLAEKELIEHEILFRAAMKFKPSANSIKHGEFTLPKGVSPVQLLEILRNEVPHQLGAETVKVTIPEGLSLAQIAELRDDSEAFMDAAHALDLTAQFGITEDSPEGFLMPNTYFFSYEPTDAELVQRMADQFNKDFEALLQRYPERRMDDKVMLLTIASLVEEEARVDDERPLVAAVIYNRLTQRMPLDMDSTLQFALNKYGQRLLNEDKEVDSPYNTYMHPGLPPGPISNPGVQSIEAAMNPADVDYLFFVSNADGKTHAFSSSLREHNNAVAKYRREIKKQRSGQ